MSFWDFFRKKEEEKKNAATDSSAGFVPMTASSNDSDSSHTDAPLPSGNDIGSATSTNGVASGGDGGGGI